MISPQKTAIAVTAAAAVLISLLLWKGRLAITVVSWPPVSQNHTLLAEIDEEFVDLFDPTPVRANPSPAYSEQPQHNLSEPADASGTDLTDAGDAGPAPVVKSSERESQIKVPDKVAPQRTGPDRKAEEQEKARRRARKGVADAFKDNTEQIPDNTSEKGKEKGDSGTPDGASSNLNGSGTGTVGGGWIMPSYAKVEARSTGSVELRAIVDADGHVASVELIGGKAPAAADAALVARCIAEVRRHRFTRTDDNAPERSTAKITYIFK